MNELLNKIEDLREEMRSILAGAESQGRNTLTAEEQKRFNELKEECTMAELKLQSRSYGLSHSGSDETTAQRFAREVAEAVEGGRQMNTSLRAIQNEPSIHDASVPLIYQELQPALEQGLILNRLGGRVLYNVQGEPIWPFVSGIEASVLGENDSVSESTLSFTTVKSTPKRISARISVSRRAIHQSNLDLHSLVLGELGRGVARKLNRIMLDGATHGEYKGMFEDSTMHTGTTITRTNPATFTFDDALELEHSVLNNMTDMLGDPVYIMNYKMAQKLRAVPVVAGQSEKLLTMHRDGNVHYAMMNGRRVELSNYVPDNLVYFGDFRYCGIPQYGDVNIIVDPYTGARTNTVQFTLNTEMDMVKIRKEAFALSKV